MRAEATDGRGMRNEPAREETEATSRQVTRVTGGGGGSGVGRRRRAGAGGDGALSRRRQVR